MTVIDSALTSRPRGAERAARRLAVGLANGLGQALRLLLGAGLVVAGVAVPPLPAQEASEAAEAAALEADDAGVDLQAALALERVVARAIARGERSVVSIARVRRDRIEGRQAFTAPDIQPGLIGPFGQPPRDPLAEDPTDPDFVPHEFATGVVIDRAGLVLTNYHVVDDQSDHYVTTVDRQVFRTRVKIKGADPRSDLAVLEVVGPVREGDFIPIEFGDAAKLRKGQFVIALGNPYAIARDGQASASWGIVANLSRKAGPLPDEQMPGGMAKDTLHHFGTLIQTDARLNLGTSGGALVDLEGRMVGLTTSLAAVAGYEQAAGYAIPVDETFLRVVETLQRGEEVEYGFLGVAPTNHDVPRGVHGARIDSVSRGTPAHRTSLRPKDIVTHVDGRPIYDADGLRLHVGKLPAGATTRLTILRDGQTLEQQVTLAKYRVRGKKIVTRPKPSWRGLEVDYPTAVVEETTTLSDVHGGCVAASEVELDSPAWKAGLRRGMLVSHVGTTPVDDPEDFRREVADVPGPIQLRLRTPLAEIKSITIDPE